jgi:hypothetical protein
MPFDEICLGQASKFSETQWLSTRTRQHDRVADFSTIKKRTFLQAITQTTH